MANTGQVATWKKLPEVPVVPQRLPLDKGGRGTLGRNIQLIANFFPIQFNVKNLVFNHFDVTIKDVWMDKNERDSIRLNPGGPAPIVGAAAAGASGAEAAIDGGGGGKKKGKKGRKRGRKGGNKPGDDGGDDDDGGEENAGVVAITTATAAVEISPGKESGDGKERRIPKAKLRKIFIAFTESLTMILRDYPLSFDGEKNAYCVGMPPQFKSIFRQTVLYTDDSNRINKYSVAIQHVNQVKLENLLNGIQGTGQMKAETSVTFQMLEVMFSYYRTVRYETVGRNKFFSQSGDFGPSYGVGGGKQGVVGFFCSLRPVAGWKDAKQLMLNVDLAHAAFYATTDVLTFIQEHDRYFNPNQRLTPGQISMMKQKFLKFDIRIVTTHTGQYKRRYKVTGISDKSAKSHTFKVDGNNGVQKTTNIVQYFKERYNYIIKYPDLQCFMVGKDSLMPIEVCDVAPNQRVKGKLGDTETAEFIKQTAIPPAQRLQQLKRAFAKTDFANDPVLKKLGVTITETPISFTGRVLPPPQLFAGDKKPFLPAKGVWDPRGKTFHTPTTTFNKWVVADFARCRDELTKFINELVKKANEKGMAATYPEHVYKSRPEDVENVLMRIAKDHNSVLIVCIIHKADNLVYKIIKSVGDRKLKLITQCILNSNILKCQPATIDNILLKINAKLGGINNTSSYKETIGAIMTQMFDQPIIIMGADVNHPPASDELTPSLVAVVGSLDRNIVTYALEVRHQAHRVEMIEDMEAITVSLLKKFREKTNVVPKRIIMYRDGVSESQFTQVLSKELLAMRSACSSLNKDYRPAITFLCVQKRHNTRLYCSDQRDGVGRAGNVPPGTVVDNTITHRTEADFYLCSHQGIQGTSKPAHYHVLWDDNDFTMDQLQLLTYSLCHNYARCNRAVSIPAPAYYAHLAAFRAKVHLEGTLGARSTDGYEFSHAELKDATWIDSTSSLRDKMFYI